MKKPKLTSADDAMRFAVGVVGGLVGWSEEHRRYLATNNRCPQCHARLVNVLGFKTVNFYSTDQSRLSSVVWFRADTVECPKCRHRWKMYGTSQAASPPPIEVLEIVETYRSEEFFGEDLRVIDNSKSSTQLTRSFSISKEWSKSYQLDFERTQSDGAELTIGVKEVPGLKLSSEEMLRRTYSMSQDSKETCTEEVSCEVPAYKKLTIAVHWKRIWQHGFVHIAYNGTPLQVPFRVAVGMTFDQRQKDEEHSKNSTS